MKEKLLNSKTTYLTSLLAVLLLLIVACFIISPTITVFADYESLSGDTIVNFNQLVKITSTTSYATLINEVCITINSDLITTNSYVAFMSGTFDTSHYYYVNIPSSLRLFNSSASTVFYGGEHVSHPSNTSSYGFYHHSSYGALNVGKYYFIIIDLTQMYGSGNEPTLDQCKNIFTAEYYNYNEGTPISLNGVNAYQQGVSDTLASLNYTIAGSVIQDLTFNNKEGLAYTVYENNGGITQVKYQCALPFGGTLVAGSTIYLTGSWYRNTSTYVSVGIIYGSTFIELYKLEGDGEQILDLTLTLPYDCDMIVFIGYNENVIPYFYLYDVLANIRTTDYTYLITNSYNNGYNVGVNDGYSKGYSAGYSAGYNAENGNIFEDTWSFISMSFTNIGDILSMEILPNLPIGLFVALPLLVGLIFFIVKLVKG